MTKELYLHEHCIGYTRILVRVYSMLLRIVRHWRNYTNTSNKMVYNFTRGYNIVNLFYLQILSLRYVSQLKKKCENTPMA